MKLSHHIPEHLLIKYYAPSQSPVVLNSIDDIAEKHNNKEKDSVLWVSLQNPTTKTLQQILPFFVQQKRALEEMETIHIRPKVVEYEGASLLVAVNFRVEHGAVKYGETQLLFGDGFLVSIWRNTPYKDLELQTYLEENADLIARGADYIVAEILDFITDDYTANLSYFEKQVEQAETQLFVHQAQQKDIQKVYQLRRVLLRIQSSISPLSELSRRFTRQNVSYIGNDSRVYFAEVSDRIARQGEMIRALRDTLAFAFEGGMMIVQLQQNDITRKLAAWAAIVAIPTAFAGVYGMNFENMPELSWRFGYPIAIGAMGVVCGSLYYRFKRMKWL